MPGGDRGEGEGGCTLKRVAAILALIATSAGAGYQVGKVRNRPADMLCVAPLDGGRTSIDLYGPDGSLWSTANISDREPIGALWDGWREKATAMAER
jgi:hypothetical protein